MAGRREREDEVAANIMSIACVCSLSFFLSFFLDHSSSQQLSRACAAHAFILHTAVPPPQKKRKEKKQTGGSEAKERRETRRDGKNNTRKKERAKKKRKEKLR